MGGNALAEFGARRYSKEEYEQTSKEVCSLLAKYNPEVIKCYSGKETFGDLDLIVDSLNEENYGEICSALNSWVYIRNNEVISILYKELQVDIIPMSKENKNTALQYYSYNDLGNLMGKIFHKFGVKYGHKGLTLPVRDGNRKIGEILLSKDPEEIFRFGGFSFSRYSIGFNTLVDLFEFIISSEYFNSEIYDYENLNSINRIRDRKRQTYHSFLEYLKDTMIKAPKGFTYPVSIRSYFLTGIKGYKFEEDKAKYLSKIFKAFPHAKKEYEDLLANLKQQNAIKAKFNGYLVNEVTGLQGISLGRFMAYLRESWGGFGPELLEQTDSTIRGRVFMEFKEWEV